MITNLVVLNILMTLILESSAAVQQELQAKVPDVPDDSADAPQRTWSRGKVGWTISTCNIYICTTRNAWALPRRCSVEGPHSQSNVVATLHSIVKINKGIREYLSPTPVKLYIH